MIETVLLPAGDGVLAAHVSGPGPRTVVLLHPWLMDSRAWDANRPDFEAEGYRVVAIDRPGHGDSPAEGPPADLAAAVMGIDARPAALIGLGEGADDALRIAVDGRVTPSALVLVSPLLSWTAAELLATPGKREEFEGQIEEWLDSPEAEVFVELAGLEDDAERADRLAEMMPATLPDGHPARALLMAMVKENAVSNFPPPESGEDLDDLLSLRAGVASLDLPVLIVTAQKNPLLDAIRRVLPEATVEIVPAGSSLVSLEHPEVFDRLASRFLRQHLG